MSKNKLIGTINGDRLDLKDQINSDEEMIKIGDDFHKENFKGIEIIKYFNNK